MSKTKRWLSIFMVITMIITLFPIDFWNRQEIRGESLIDGDYKYQLRTDGTVRIDGYTGKNKEVYIPATLANRTVTEIKQDAFNNNNDIELVNLSGTQIVEVGDQAFANCKSLKKVVLPSTLKTISRKLFYGSTALEEVEIPEGVQEISIGAFYRCSALKSIAIPDSVTSMKSSSSDQTFYNCTSLESVVIGDNVSEIAANTFMNCGNLTTISLGKSISKIGSNAFKGCKSLQSISIPDNCTSIGIEAFSGCIAMTEVNLGNGMQSIDEGAFNECSSLVSIVFPDSLTAIKSKNSKSTFGKCNALKTIVFGRGLTTIPEAAFKDCVSLEEIYVDGNIETIQGSAFSGCTMLSAMYCMDEKCPTISSSTAFADCKDFIIYCLENGDKLGKYGEVMIVSKVFDKSDKICTVSFDRNDSEAEPITKEAIIGRPVSSAPIPQKDGYHFAGW